MAKKDDLYITALKYAREKSIEGGNLNIQNFQTHVQDIHPKADPNAIALIYNQAIDSSAKRGFIRLPAYFLLLEHEALREARQSSSRSLRVAIGALVISTLVGISSIITSSL